MSTATLTPPTRRATMEDLMRVEGKAELVGGKVVEQMGAGVRHNRTASRIFLSLFEREKQVRDGFAVNDNPIFGVEELSSDRESFSPDAAYIIGAFDENDPGCFEGPPTFAVEVRSPEEYGPAAERNMAAKRADYFEAGTRAVWDVDPEAESVTLYRVDGTSARFLRGDTAHAEPALPGWTMPVDAVFGAART